MRRRDQVHLHVHIHVHEGSRERENVFEYTDQHPEPEEEGDHSRWKPLGAAGVVALALLGLVLWTSQDPGASAPPTTYPYWVAPITSSRPGSALPVVPVIPPGVMEGEDTRSTTRGSWIMCIEDYNPPGRLCAR